MFYPSYILLSSFVVINACGAAIEPSTDIISIRNVNRRILNYIGQEKDRFKRSSPNFFTIVKDKVTGGIKSKLSKIASSSKHSSGSGGEHQPEPAFYHEHDDPHAYEHEHYHHHPEYHSDEPFEVKSFDFWDLQKSILHTLLQAAKAIKGGLIAVKGHLIKGSGYVISAKGKLLAAKGEAISNLGKHIASTAVLSPYPPHHHLEHHPVYEPEYSHGQQFESYSPHHEHHHENYHHEEPQHYEAHMKSPSKGIHGILVLQKIPKPHSDDLSLHGHHGIPSLPDSFVPDYIQSDPKSNLKSIIRNYLLSSSHHKLNPNPIHVSEDDKFSDHYISLPSHEEGSKIFEPTPNSVDYQDFKHESDIEHKFNDNNTSIPSDHFQSNNNPNSNPVYETSHLKPPSTNYGVPFELKGNFNYPKGPPTQNNVAPVSELETYEPLFFPDNTAQYMLQRPDNFANNPVEFSNVENNFNVNQNLHPSYSQANHLLNHFNKFGNLPELEVSSSEHKQSVYPKRVVQQRYKSKYSNNKHVSNKSRRTRPNVTKRKLPSHNKIYRPSRTQRPLTKL